MARTLGIIGVAVRLPGDVGSTPAPEVGNVVESEDFKVWGSEMVIWKYELQITDYQDIHVPEGARLLSIHNQHDVLCIWVYCDPERKTETWTFQIFGTGQTIDPHEGYGMAFVGTVVMGLFVWHVFKHL